MTNREIFVSLYTDNIKRPGAAELLAYLERSDFFTAPASTRYHSACEGGLCAHSINVLKRLCEIAPNTAPETAAICGLLHDLCKVGFYTVAMRNAKNDQGKWEQKPYYTIDDKLPYGHGEKSVYMIERFMRLSTEEAMAIRWHMGGFDDNKSCGNAFAKYPLAVALHMADLQATYLDEVITNGN